jgi:2-amino-4-hydroxy-6-hydroxymethyldihydropteridine diphosphokinase
VEVTAYVGVGSNLGDRLEHLRRAVAELAGTPGVRFVRSSSVYATSPVGGPEQGDFLNAVVEISTELEPHALLGALQRIENALGRVRAERFGPRTIDLDLLLYGDDVIDDADLCVPHPRMRERAFVVVPLTELGRADAPLPGGGSLEPVSDASQTVRRFGPPLALEER